MSRDLKQLSQVVSRVSLLQQRLSHGYGILVIDAQHLDGHSSNSGASLQNGQRHEFTLMEGARS